MAKTADEMVVEIRKFFQDPEVGNHELLKLWNVLTGLRGPDAGERHIKDATTAVIRHFVVQMDLHEEPRFLPIDIADADSDARATVRREMAVDNGVSPHFLNHAERAFTALGLSWDHTNVEPKSGVSIFIDEAKGIPVDPDLDGCQWNDPNPGGD